MLAFAFASAKKQEHVFELRCKCILSLQFGKKCTSHDSACSIQNAFHQKIEMQAQIYLEEQNAILEEDMQLTKPAQVWYGKNLKVCRLAVVAGRCHMLSSEYEYEYGGRDTCHCVYLHAPISVDRHKQQMVDMWLRMTILL